MLSNLELGCTILQALFNNNTPFTESFRGFKFWHKYLPNSTTKHMLKYLKIGGYESEPG